MNKVSFKAPGSTMIMGEHAILHGQPAIAAAVDKWMTVSVEKRCDQLLTISSQLGTYSSDIQQLQPSPTFNFILAVIEQYQSTSGFDIIIDSQFSHTVGLGSSAAVTAATCACFEQLTNGTVNQQTIFDKSLSAILAVQGRGSGSDLAASVFGGLVKIEINEGQRQITPLATRTLPAIGLWYVGYKTKTVDVLKIVEAKSQENPERYQQIYQQMGTVTKRAIDAIEQNNWAVVGHEFTIFNSHMKALGVSDANLEEVIQKISENNDVLGCKISGSGLGDCVLALGSACFDIDNFQSIPVSITPQGVTLC